MRRSPANGLPADVASDDDVAAEDDVRRHLLVDGVGDDGRGHRELHRAGVYDADNVAGSRGLQDAEEWSVTAVLCVKLNDLFVVSEIGAIRNETQQLRTMQTTMR